MHKIYSEVDVQIAGFRKEQGVVLFGVCMLRCKGTGDIPELQLEAAQPRCSSAIGNDGQVAGDS